MAPLALLPESEDLLVQLVERSRSRPKNERTMTAITRVPSPVVVLADGENLPVDHQSLRDLEVNGMICRTGTGALDSFGFYVTPLGLRVYAEIRQRGVSPQERVERVSRRYLEDESFKREYPRTADKIQVADAALWSSDEGQLTVVGHTCREAMQAFAGEVLDRLEVAPDDPDTQHTVARMKQAIAAIRGRPVVGDAEGELLEALFHYWGLVADVVQRQEHGGQREKEPVTQEDARRALFQTINVTNEIARTVERALRAGA